MNRHNYDPHLTEEETKPQRDELTCRRSHNQSVAEPGLEPGPAAAEPPLAMGGGLCGGQRLCGFGSEATNLPQSHVDSDSSSSHSRQETPPTASVAAPIITVESASGFGPATPPQRHCSSTQVRLRGWVWVLGSGSGQELRLQRGEEPQADPRG